MLSQVFGQRYRVSAKWGVRGVGVGGGGCYKPNCIPMYLSFVQVQTKIPNEQTMVAID